MKRFYGRGSALLFAAFLFATNANSQNTRDMTFSSSKVVTDSVPDKPTTPKYEFGVGGGLVVYQGDLAPTTWGTYKSPMFGIQAHVTRFFSPAFALRLGVVAGHFGAEDVKSDYKQAYREYRRYDFKTSFAELSLVAQWTPFAKANWRLNPYLLGGVGATYLDVKNNWNNTDYSQFPGENLPGRLAEDEAKDHQFFTPVLPVGVGLKYDASSRVALRLEWINRITFSDYLDGFSKAANPNKNDRYSTIMLSLNFAFGKNRSSGTMRNSNVVNNYYNYYYNSKSSKSENSMALANGMNKQNSSPTETPINNDNAALMELQAKLDKINQKLDQTRQSDKELNDFAKFDKYIIYFSFDHYYLEGDSFSKLDQIANMMKADPKLNVTLNGYTDLKGASDYNMKLSSARSLTCKKYLISKGVDAGRITTDAFGKTKYVIGNLSKEQQWVNRRVEVYFN